LPDDWDRKFRDDLASDVAFERRLLVKELCIIAVIVALVLVREILL